MSNIYLNVPVEKNWGSQNFDFLSLKNLSLGQFRRASTLNDIIKFQNFLLQLKNKRCGSKITLDFSIILILTGIMT